MSEITNIDNINEELTRPADSSDPSNWELEKDQWGKILNLTTLSQIDDNSRLLKKILYAHDAKIEAGTDLISVRDYILNNMLTDGVTAGIVYRTETGTIEINNEIDRHVNVLGVDYTIRDYFKKDSFNTWRHYFKGSDGIEKYMLIQDDYTVLSGLITDNTTNITTISNQLNNLIAEGLGSNVWKNSSLTGNATTYDEPIVHGNSIRLKVPVNNGLNLLLESNNTFFNILVKENSDLTTATIISFNSEELEIVQKDPSTSLETKVFKLSKNGTLMPVYGQGNFSTQLTSVPYVLGVDSSGLISEIPSTEFNTGGGIPETEIFYQDLGIAPSTWAFGDFEVDQELLDNLGTLSLTKYNSLSANNKTIVNNLLLSEGISDPTDLTSIENALNNNSKITSILLKIYSNSIRIVMDKEYSIRLDSIIGIDNHIISSKVTEIILQRKPNKSSYINTGSMVVTGFNRQSLGYGTVYPHSGSPDIALASPTIVNYKENGAPSNKFGIVTTSEVSTQYYETPKYIGKYPLRQINTANSYNVINYRFNFSSINIGEYDEDYGDKTLFAWRSFKIGYKNKYISYGLNFRYSANQTGTTKIIKNIPSVYCPSNYVYSSGGASSPDGIIDITIYGSDGSISYGRLFGANNFDAKGYLEHYGSKSTGIVYTAYFQFLNQLI